MAFGFSNLYSVLPRAFRSDKIAIVSFFLLGVVLRAIPEIIIQQYPVGYETITWYAPVINAFPGKTLPDVFIENFRAGPLFYVLLWCAFTVTGASSFVLLKVAGPIFYGCLVASFFWFMRKGMNFNLKMACVASLILTFQVAALRQSWDRLRNILALTFVFFASTTLLRDRVKFKWGWIAGLSILTVLSREYIAVMLFAAILGFNFLTRRMKKWECVKLIIVLIPAFIIFAIMVNPPGLWRGHLLASSNALGNYLYTVQDAAFIFLLCYFPLLPLVLRGFRRHEFLDPLVIFLSLGSFSIVIPWFAVPGYQRWLMLLVFPFSIYAAYGIEGLLSRAARVKTTAILLMFLAIGTVYVSGVFPYGWILPNSYVPRNLTQSSIQWDQVDDVREVLSWLDENAVVGSSILTEERFLGWTRIYLKRANDDITIVSYAAGSPPWKALESVLSSDFQRVYLIWYNDSDFEGFFEVYSCNSVAAFQYGL